MVRQQAQFGEIIDLNSPEVADIIGFAHNKTEQKELEDDQIPERSKDEILQ